MSLNESIVEDAALTMPAASLTRPLPWGEEQSRVARTLTPTLSHGERGSHSEVVQSRVARTLILAFSHGEKEKLEAIWRLNPAIPEEARATILNFRTLRFERSLP